MRKSAYWVISTFQFANAITQNTLDQDSILNLASNITGMPFLLAYNESLPILETAVSDLINSGNITEAKHSTDRATGETRLQELLEIALWYLHQDGTHRQDLDSASRFIQLALTESIATGSSGWLNECRLQLAEVQYQKGNIEQSSLLFSRLAETALQANKREITAHAYMRMADLLGPTDTSKENLFYKSLTIYRSLGFKEKQIELLWKIELCHEHRDFSLAKKDLLEIIEISNKIGFKHTLYAQNRLAFVLMNLEDYLGAMDYARVALDNMKWSGFSEVQGTFYIRMGQAYSAFGKNNEVAAWLNKAVAEGTKKSHLFWYKGIPILAGHLFDMNKPADALSMTERVTSKFPPVTVWEKMQLLALFGVCNELNKKTQLADKYFNQLLKLAKENPWADPYGEMSGDYLGIAQLYLSRDNLAMARLFLETGMIKERSSAAVLSMKYSLNYKMDSLEGNYKSALQNHIKYKFYLDSSISMDQRKKMDELTVKYAAAKKDQDITLLKQQGIAQQAALKENELTRNIMIGGSVMLLIFLGLLYNRFRLKQKTNKQLESQQKEIAQKNTSLQELVEQKEWLLKEVHHRVKNNLQIIISLLNTQSNYLDSDAAIKAIRESQERMNAISLIHQKLYKSEDTALINIKEYVHELVEHIRKGFSGSSGIVFDLNIIDSQMDVAQAVPLGLILNEAVSNIFKYAYPGKLSGMVNISITHTKDDIGFLLAVRDNGAGLPLNYDITKKASFGIRLMQGLSKQMGGSFKIENNNGVRLEVAFAGSKMIKLIGRKKPQETFSNRMQGLKAD